MCSTQGSKTTVLVLFATLGVGVLPLAAFAQILSPPPATAVHANWDVAEGQAENWQDDHSASILWDNSRVPEGVAAPLDLPPSYLPPPVQSIALSSYETSGDVAIPAGDQLCACGKGCADGKSCGAKHAACRLSAFAELLYLRPGNIDVAFAQEYTGTTDDDSPTGPMGISRLGFETGLRGGLRWALTDCSSIGATYTWYETDAAESITRTSNNSVLNSLVAHPSLDTVGFGSISASSQSDFDMELIDLDYRHSMWRTCTGYLDYVLGVRYARLGQQFVAQQDIFAAAGLTTVATDVAFEGFGIRLGLDGQRRSALTGLLIYARTDISAVTGNTTATYQQTNQFGGSAVIGNDFEDYRTLTLLDGELGVGWSDACERWRVTVGYLTSYWLNTLTTDSYIGGVRGGDFGDLSETLTLSGLTARVGFTY
jgi:hypothetical protein